MLLEMRCIMKINANNIIDVRSIGFKALAEALGPVGFARFIQQYDNGSGDYTKEKYESPDDFESWAQLASELKKFNDPVPFKQTI